MFNETEYSQLQVEKIQFLKVSSYFIVPRDRELTSHVRPQK